MTITLALQLIYYILLLLTHQQCREVCNTVHTVVGHEVMTWSSLNESLHFGEDLQIIIPVPPGLKQGWFLGRIGISGERSPLIASSQQARTDVI